MRTACGAPLSVRRTGTLIPDEFPQTGLWCPKRPISPVTRFQVLGERSCGTNFVKRLLGRNSSLVPSEMLGWKHGFCQTDAIPPDLAVICVVRNAQDWVRSMFAKPWHCSPAMQALEFSEFIRAPWDTIIDRPRYFEDAAKRGLVGQPLQHDRHPLSGLRFENIFALRRIKLAGLLSYLSRDCTALLLCLETAQAHPEATLDTLLFALGHPKPVSGFRPVHKRLGSKFKPAITPRPSPPKAMNTNDRAFMVSQLDMQLETQLGYDCGG